MAAKTGGNRRAPAAATKVTAGAAVSPADVQETLIPTEAPVTEAVDSSSVVEVLAAVSGLPEAVVEEVAAEVIGAAAEPAEPEVSAADAAVNRLAALAALTGAPAPLDAPAAVVVPEVEPSGDHQGWPDGDEPLVTGVVAFSVYQAIVAGQLQHAYKGETLHATEAVIARGVALGALVRV